MPVRPIVVLLAAGLALVAVLLGLLIWWGRRPRQ
jgi:hypothetical protein